MTPIKNLPSKRGSRDSLAREHTRRSRFTGPSYKNGDRLPRIDHVPLESGHFRTSLLAPTNNASSEVWNLQSSDSGVRERPPDSPLFLYYRGKLALRLFYVGWMLLTNADLSSHTINQLLGIVADPGLKHRLDVLDLVNSF
jgi:hypothetical protein